MKSWSVVLSSDRAVMTSYSGMSFLGFGHCVPYRLVPEILLRRVLGSPVRTDSEGRALRAPYPLRKIEASLLSSGFKRDEVIVTTPTKIDKVVSRKTKIVGLSVLDPMGKAPVSWTLSSLFGGGDSCSKVEFLRFMRKVRKLKEKYGFTLIVGGQGVWQLVDVRETLGIDVLFFGEGEVTFPKLAREIIDGKKPPPIVYGETPSVDQIPAIVEPSRLGEVQVTRGCPRCCRFCSPTMWKFRSIPLSKILAESEINVRGGTKQINLLSDDVLLYGAEGVKVNSEAVIRLFEIVREKYGVNVSFPHVSVATVRQDPNLVRKITEIAGFDEGNPAFPQVGLESGSPRIIAKYMSGKPRPWTPEEWSETVIEASRIMNENYWYPCYTLMIGFPGETEDDIISTIELIDELRRIGVKAWIFPLIMVPIGKTRMEKEKYPSIWEMPEAVWELLYISWSYSMRFTREIYHQLFRHVKNQLMKRLIERLLPAILNLLEGSFRQIRKDPRIILKAYSRINLHSIRGVLNIIRAYSLGEIPIRLPQG